MWIDKNTGAPVLFLIKEDGKVMRLDVFHTPTDIPGDETLVPPQAQSLGNDKYTTPTGKSVDVAKYSSNTPVGTSEIWTSDQVPFWEVQNFLDGKLMSSLYDFAFDGAVRSISKQEAENAEIFGFSDIPGDGDIPGGGDVSGGDDIPDGGDIPGGQQGDIVVTVGAGAQPVITVSQPIMLLTLTGPGVAWGFQSVNQAADLSGPFQYGVTPNGALDIMGGVAPPDLVAGQVYNIQVMGEMQGFIPLMGEIEFAADISGKGSHLLSVSYFPHVFTNLTLL